MRCYLEMKAVRMLAWTQTKLNSGTSASTQNWKVLYQKFKGTFFNYELAIYLYKQNFIQAILFWGFNLYSLCEISFHSDISSSDGVQNEIRCFRGRQRWRCSTRGRAGCSLRIEYKWKRAGEVYSERGWHRHPAIDSPQLTKYFMFVSLDLKI